eukprot:204323_1
MSLIASLCLLLNLRQLIAAECATYCTSCTDKATCIASTASGLCAYSTAGGCISRSSTPFVVIETESTCSASGSLCEGIGATLASIHSLEENEWALSMCAVSGSDGGDCYIGLNRHIPVTAFPFTWSDGSTFDYGIPSNGAHPMPPWETATTDYCVLIDDASSGSGGWLVRDATSTKTDYVLCRTEPVQSVSSDSSSSSDDDAVVVEEVSNNSQPRTVDISTNDNSYNWWKIGCIVLLIMFCVFACVFFAYYRIQRNKGMVLVWTDNDHHIQHESKVEIETMEQTQEQPILISN